MKLYLLRPHTKYLEDDPEEEFIKDKDNPWEPWYDKTFGFVVCALNEKSARNYAAKDGGREVKRLYDKETYNQIEILNPWLDSKYSSCVELNAETVKAGVVIKDFVSA